MPIGDTPPATLPIEWPPIFWAAVERLSQLGGHAKKHNLRFLLPLLNQWNVLPGLDADGVPASTLVDHAYRYYEKRPTHVPGGDTSLWLKLFTGFRQRAENDWRAAINSQRGFGCFATGGELGSAPFKVEPRSECVHRVAPAGGSPP